MTLSDIARLRACETVILTSEVNITREQWVELLDAAEAWELLQATAEEWELSHGTPAPLGWHLSMAYGGDLFCGPKGSGFPCPTPQDAVLATLRGKGAGNERMD